MFKVGDKIRAKKNNSFGNNAYERYKDMVLTVVKNCQMRSPGDDFVCYIDPITGSHNGWCLEFFELVQDKIVPKTEIQYLDAFKENFKDGV